MTTTNIILLFMVHPTLVKVMFDMFNCDEIDGDLRLVKDMDTVCYESTHLYLAIFLAIPGIVVWGFGIPLTTISMLYQNKKNLDDDRIQKELGFLYHGYKYKAYYWEEYIMIRKMIIIFCSTFLATQGKLYQSLVVMFLLAIFLSLHALVKPFHTPAYNKLETFSLVSSFITMYGGYFFLAEEITSEDDDFNMPKGYKVVFFLVILFFQALFFLSWLYQLYLELKRFVEMKSQYWYNKIFMCNNPKRIEASQEKKRKRRKYEEIEQALNTMMDDFEYLVEADSSGKLNNADEFEYFITQSIAKLKGFDALANSSQRRRVEDEPSFTTRRNLKTSKVTPLDEAMNGMNMDMDMFNEEFELTPKLKINTGLNEKKKKRVAIPKEKMFKGLFKSKRLQRRKYIINDADTENNPSLALQKYCQEHFGGHPSKGRKKETESDNVSIIDEEERQERVRHLVSFIRSFGIKSLELKRNQNKGMMNKSKPKEALTPDIPRNKFYNDTEINELIEEEKQYSENNGMGIELFKMQSYSRGDRSPDKSALDLDNTIGAFNVTDDRLDDPRRLASNNLFNDANTDRKKGDENDGGILYVDEDEEEY